MALARDLAALDAARGLHQMVVTVLGRRIVDGSYPVGTSLPNEGSLGQELKVSRTVVREAVKVLAEKGLVKSQRKLGTQVLPEKSWSWLDPDVLSWAWRDSGKGELLQKLTEVRLLIEPAAARLAAERGTEEDHALLSAQMEAFQVARHGSRARIDADIRLHAAIAESAHNELFLKLWEAFASILRQSFRVSRRTQTDEAPHHRAIVDAVLRRDGRAAEEAMRQLIEMTDLDVRTLGSRSANVATGRGKRP